MILYTKSSKPSYKVEATRFKAKLANYAERTSMARARLGLPIAPKVVPFGEYLKEF